MEKIFLYIFIVIGALLIYQSYLMGVGRKKKKRSLIIIKKSKRFNSKQTNKVSPDKFKEYINGIDIKYLQERPGWFELYEDEKIVFLNVPWGEAYCQCNADEYKELTSYIYTKYH